MCPSKFPSTRFRAKPPGTSILLVLKPNVMQRGDLGQVPPMTLASSVRFDFSDSVVSAWFVCRPKWLLESVFLHRVHFGDNCLASSHCERGRTREKQRTAATLGKHCCGLIEKSISTGGGTMINLESRTISGVRGPVSRPWRILLLNLLIVVVAMCVMLTGGATMPLLGSAAGTAKPVVAALFGLYILMAPVIVMLSRPRLTGRRLISAVCVAGFVLFYLGGMLLG